MSQTKLQWASANWVAGLVVRGMVDMEDAQEMMMDLVYRLAKRAYTARGHNFTFANNPDFPLCWIFQ